MTAYGRIVKVGTVLPNEQGGFTISGWEFDCAGLMDAMGVDLVNGRWCGYTVEELREIAIQAGTQKAVTAPERCPQCASLVIVQSDDGTWRCRSCLSEWEAE